jgi:hypothetical protein
LDQGCEGLWRERPIVVDVSGKPQRHQGFEAFGTGEIRSQPDPLQGLKEGLVVIQRRSTPFALFWFLKPPEPPEQTDGMLTMIPRDGTEFIKDCGFVLT